MTAPETILDEMRQKGVYFSLPSPELHFLSISLAEGLEELGVPVLANIRAYPRPYPHHSPYLFNQNLSPPEQAALVVIDVSSIDDNVNLGAAAYQALRALQCRRVALCMADQMAGSFLPVEIPSEVPTFMAHVSTNLHHAGWRIPWAFGLSNDILRQAEAARGRNPVRRRAFVRNFRPSLKQAVRQCLDLAFVSPLSRHFEIDRRIDDGYLFQSGHYDRLARAIGCLAYGGNFEEDYSRNEAFRKSGLKVARVVGDDPIIVRWDSWRLWESLASGCVTVALDFAEYGFCLPVMPQNGVHYVGLRLDRIGETIEFLSTASDDQLAAIGEAGRAWALEHYSPKAVAVRFAEKIAKSYST